MSNVGVLIAIVLAVVIIGWIAIRLLSSSYIKTTPTAAFVRTGGLRRAPSNRPLVVVNSAAWVFNFLHRIKWVSLETMALEVRHTEDRALVTNDPQYVDLEARFFIKVGESVDQIGIAARTIGGDVVDEASVRRLAEPKINGAVRDVAAMFSLKNLLEKRIDFIKQVQERLRADLAENGLVLESISILTLRPTLQGHYSTDDLLGAQVARANSAVIEQALTDKNRLETQGALERARQDAQAERERMGIEEEIERERAQRARSIAMVRAAEEAAARVAQEQKREEAEKVRIAADRALQAERIENERQEMLLREQMQRAAETEHVLREQAVALAEQEREQRIAEAMAIKLAAIRAQIEADRERERALQEAMTAAEKAAAERDAEIELINARLEAEKLSLENRNQVEMEALRLKELANAEREIAEAQAQAARIRAQADLDAARLTALAERERTSAPGLAEVQVSLERVRVTMEEAEAIRRKLLAEAEGEQARAQALASAGGVGQQLELARINAEVQKAVEIARAQALGEAIGGMKMNLFGDTTMASRLLQLVATGQSAQYVYEALPPALQGMVRGVADRLAGKPGANPNSSHAASSGLRTLIELVQSKYPDALHDERSTLTLGDMITLLNSDDLPESVRGMLRRVADNPHLHGLSVHAALALIQAWLGSE